MPDKPPHIRLVRAELEAVRDFRSYFAATRTAFALCDRTGVLVGNDAFGQLGLVPDRDAIARLFDADSTGEAEETASSPFVVGPWCDSSSLRLLEFAERLAEPVPRLPPARDPISGLLDATAFDIEIEKAVAVALPADEALVLFQVDFPQFDDIDRARRATFLRETGQNISAALEPGAIAARREGARFAFLFHCHGTKNDVAASAPRLIEKLTSNRRLIGGQEGVVRPRLGFAIMPDDTRDALDTLGGQCTGGRTALFAETAASLKSCADLALAQAMAREATPSVRFSSSLVIERRRREELARAVGPAVDNGEMKVAFQPVIDIATMKLAGFEALLRWRHPEYGPVPPPEAVALAEANGALTGLTRHVMNEAVARAQDWPDDLCFAINVTPTQLEPELVGSVAAMLRDSGLPPAKFEIEVTEDALIKDVDLSARVIDAVRSLGVRVAMDDFGAGFTSLSNLKRLSFDKIKIDRSLCDGLGENDRTDAIVGGLVRLAHRLGIEATVEGVETDEQLAALSGLPCLVQGYVFSPPVPAAGMEVFRPMLARPERPIRRPAATQRSRPARRRAAS